MNKEHESHFVQWLLIGISVLFLAIMLLLPLSYVLITAFSQGINAFWKAVSDKYAVRSILLTVEITLITVVFNTIFGLAAAWCLTRFTFKGKKFVTTLIDLPLTISPVIAGLIYILTFGRQSILYSYLKSAGIKLIFAVPGMIAATIFVTLPFVSREIIPILNARGTDEEEAAALMGAGGFQIFREITFPHIKWPLLYGVVLCSARAMGEFGAVSVLSGHLRGKTTTMPLYIEMLYQDYDMTGAFAVSAILVLMAVLILIVRSLLEAKGKKQENSEEEALI